MYNITEKFKFNSSNINDLIIEYLINLYKNGEL